MIEAGLTLGVLMSLAVAYFIGKQVQERAYRRALERARESQLGPVLRLDGPKVKAKALSVAELDALRLNPMHKLALFHYTKRAVERRKIVEEVHPWRAAAND